MKHVELQLREVNRRLDRIEEVSDSAPPNCMGTILYLIGEREKDSFGWITPKDEEICLERGKYKQTDEPHILDIALWYDPFSYAFHAGLVVGLEDMPIIRSRLGCGNHCPIKDLPAEKVMAEMGCDKVNAILRYYTKSPNPNPN